MLYKFYLLEFLISNKPKDLISVYMIIFRLINVLIFLISIPFQLYIAIILLIELRKFPLFFQERGVTLNNKFKILKFRTMRFDIEDEDTKKEHSTDIFKKPSLKKYVPRFSAWLRRSGLDELPQLWNVCIKRDMNYVGPRPLTIKDLQNMKDIFPSYYEKREKLKSLPGITGLWQLFGKREIGIENLIELDELYEKNKSFRLDIKLLIETFKVMLFASNSDAIVNHAKPKKSNLTDFIK